VWQPGQTPNHTYTHCVMDAADDCVASTLTQADADLIAAAHEMLAALKEALPFIAHFSSGWSTHPRADGRAASEIAEQIAAAIAKAEGGGQ